MACWYFFLLFVFIGNIGQYTHKKIIYLPLNYINPTELLQLMHHNAALHTDVLMYNRFVIQFNCDFYFDLLNSLCILCPSFCVLIKMPLNWNLNGLAGKKIEFIHHSIDWVNSELFCIQMYNKLFVYCAREHIHTAYIYKTYIHMRGLLVPEGKSRTLSTGFFARCQQLEQNQSIGRIQCSTIRNRLPKSRLHIY